MAYRVGFLLYPKLTQLDLTGPAQILSRMPDADVLFLWKTVGPVMSDCGLALSATHSLADCPQLDMVCVPGGYGCTDMMGDPEVLGWLRSQANGAQLVTSVCTGSLILAAAGLLNGYRAACHWAWRDQLGLFGAIPVADRVVFDRNRITGGGVTAGIDFAFSTIEHLHGRDVAEMVQLTMEYDPEPLGRGTPEKARPEIVAKVNAAIKEKLGNRPAVIADIAARFPTS